MQELVFKESQRLIRILNYVWLCIFFFCTLYIADSKALASVVLAIIATLNTEAVYEFMKAGRQAVSLSNIVLIAVHITLGIVAVCLMPIVLSGIDWGYWPAH